MAYFLKKTKNKKGLYLQIYESFYDPVHIAKLNGRICGAKRSHSVSDQPNCYQSV